MIAMDIETSGLDKVKCGIWQIGAVDIDHPSETFLQEARIDDENLIEEGATKVHGKNEAYLKDKNKQSQKQLLDNFFKWVEERKTMKNFLCENPQFDIGFIEIKTKKYRLKMPVSYRAFDLHTIAQVRHLCLKEKFLIKEERSDMGLKNILEFVGMQDNRTEHNALEDAMLTAECFSRLVFGKNLFSEFEGFEIPSYLQRGVRE